MNRRDFLKYAASVSFFSIFTTNAMARLNCGSVVPPGVKNCMAGIDSAVAIKIARIQQENQWCWAACIEMIFAYNGFEISQSAIVESTWGNIVNMPASDQQIMRDLNRPWTDHHGKRFRTSATVVGAAAAARELANNMPLIICTTGHAMVLTALNYVTNPFTTNGEVKEAIVRDPWETNGRRSLTAHEWFNTNLLLAVRCF